MKCNSYDEIVCKRTPTEFERGYHLAMFGEYLTQVTETRAYCNGTKDHEMCTCGGDRRKCDFYPENRKPENVAKYEKEHAPKFGEWISVGRQEPPTNKDILVCTNKGKIFTYSFGIGEGFSDITHWMPLPKPPKEG